MMRKALLVLACVAMSAAALPGEAATIKTARGTYVTAIGLRPIHTPVPGSLIREPIESVTGPLPPPLGIGGYNFTIPSNAKKKYILKSIQVVDAAGTGSVGVLVFFTKQEVQDGACTNAKGFVNMKQEITGKLQPGDSLRINVLPYENGQIAGTGQALWQGAEDTCTGVGTTGEIIIKYEIRNA